MGVQKKRNVKKHNKYFSQMLFKNTIQYNAFYFNKFDHLIPDNIVYLPT